MSKIYLIGIGGTLIPDLAIVLKENGCEEVIGVDEHISEEIRNRLDKAGISYYTQWDAGHVDSDIDFVIPAPHIQADNPEIQQAENLKLQIVSIPEFVHYNTKGKTRLVVSGSKGKRSLMQIIILVLKEKKITFDYIISRPLPGIEKIAQFSDDNRVAIIEGDELISFPVKKKHKLEFYRPHIALLPNIQWTASNEFPSKESYLKVFNDFIQTIERDGKFIYNEQDKILKEFSEKIREDITAIPYTAHAVVKEGDTLMLDTRFGKYPIASGDDFFLENLNGARNACKQLGIAEKDFYAAISEISKSISFDCKTNI